jgi:imidazolonepropionase-like amidohydrolase
MVPVVAALLAALQIPGAPESSGGPGILAIEGARILTMAGSPVDSGTVLIAEGKVKAVGASVEVPADAKRIDARGKTVIPGLIDALSRLYVYPEELAEGTAVAPELRIMDGIDPYAEHTDEVLRHGVTAVQIAPGDRSLLGGMTAVLKVEPQTGVVGLITDSAAVRGQIGVPAGDTNSSLARLTTYASIREALLSTQDYLFVQGKYDRDLARYDKKRAEALAKADGDAAKAQLPERPRKPATERNYAVLARVLKGELPLQIEAHRVADILNALRLKDEFAVSLVLLGCSEGYRIPGEIARRHVPVIVAPVSLSFSGPAPVRYGEHSRANAAVLAKAGVKVALGVGGTDGLQSKFVRACAAIAAANGLDRDLALRAVTANAAEMLGVSNRLGTIAEGRDADLVLLDGDPLSTLSTVETVVLDGAVVYQKGGDR